MYTRMFLVAGAILALLVFLALLPELLMRHKARRQAKRHKAKR